METASGRNDLIVASRLVTGKGAANQYARIHQHLEGNQLVSGKCSSQQLTIDGGRNADATSRPSVNVAEGVGNALKPVFGTMLSIHIHPYTLLQHLLIRRVPHFIKENGIV
jgi:hypothetical protein